MRIKKFFLQAFYFFARFLTIYFIFSLTIFAIFVLTYNPKTPPSWFFGQKFYEDIYDADNPLDFLRIVFLNSYHYLLISQVSTYLFRLKKT
jgi:hypothetical protein